MLEQAGAAAVVADALDAMALTQAVQSAKPEIVVDLLTAIPKTGPTRPEHMRATNELRVRGTANLLRAAIAAGARRIVAESMTFAYGLGDHGDVPAVESEPLRVGGPYSPGQEAVDSLRSMEDQLREASARGQIEAIPLRYGLLYGSDAITHYMLRMLEKRLLPIAAGARGLASWVHTSDAVSATIAAMQQGRVGEIYNVVDDCPVGMNDWMIDAAVELGARHPLSVPLWLLRRVLPYAANLFSMRLPVSNEKARRELHWQPRFPSYREGLRQAVAEYRNAGAQTRRDGAVHDSAGRDRVRRDNAGAGRPAK
jgi:nucleoside-diphosphate-sugar epimerase